MTEVINPFHKIADNITGVVSANFQDDPQGFIKYHWPNAVLTEKQIEVLESVRVHIRTAVHTGHKVGKDWIAARIAIWFLNSFQPSIVLTTAPSERQVKMILWGQINNAYRTAVIPLKGRCTSQKIAIDDLWYALGFTTKDYDAETFTGFAAENVLIIGDEASGLTLNLMEQLETLLVGITVRLLLIGNPLKSSGVFADAIKDKIRFNQVHINSEESPNVVANKIIYPGMVTREWIEDKKKKWGVNSTLYRIRVLGFLPEEGEDILIKMELIEAAFERGLTDSTQIITRVNEKPIKLLAVRKGLFGKAEEREILKKKELLPGEKLVEVFEKEESTGMIEYPSIGVDVGGTGSGLTVIKVVAGGRELFTEKGAGWKTGEIVGRIIKTAKNYGVAQNRISIDAIGVGKGVYDGMREKGWMVNAVIFGGVAEDNEQYADRRTELYGKCGELLRDGAISFKDEELLSQLSDLEISYDRNSRIKLESKEQMKKRGKPSPDEADAYVMALSTPIQGGFPVSLEEVKPRIKQIEMPKNKMIGRFGQRWNPGRKRIMSL